MAVTLDPRLGPATHRLQAKQVLREALNGGARSSFEDLKLLFSATPGKPDTAMAAVEANFTMALGTITSAMTGISHEAGATNEESYKRLGTALDQLNTVPVKAEKLKHDPSSATGCAVRVFLAWLVCMKQQIAIAQGHITWAIELEKAAVPASN